MQEESSSEYETDSDDDAPGGGRMLKPLFIPRAARDVRMLICVCLHGRSSSIKTISCMLSVVRLAAAFNMKRSKHRADLSLFCLEETMCLTPLPRNAMGYA